MKKNIRDYKTGGVQFSYILDACDAEALGCPATDKDVIFAVLDNFNAEFNYENNRKRYTNLQDRLEEWLRGLPTGVNVLFWDNDIEELGKSWGYCQTPGKAAKFVENYWHVLAFRFIQLGEYFGYDVMSLA